MGLTPVEDHEGLLLKREDLFRGPAGTNGSKLRACQYLVRWAQRHGAQHIVSAQSVLSPQAAMTATQAAERGLECTIIVGGTTPEKAVRHPSIRTAVEAGAHLEAIAVGYNPALQKACREKVESLSILGGDAWGMPYGITTPEDWGPEEIRGFLEVGGAQVANLPDTVRTLVIPFGSGNTAAGILYGLHQQSPMLLERVVLVGVGPDRLEWLKARLETVGLPLLPEGVDLEHIPLHPWYATYGDRMPETLDGVVLHPTYEGKVVRYLNEHPEISWWSRRDGSTCLWIVGGPLG